MLGLLKPKSPLEIREKVWTERRMHWLTQRFGLERMKSATIVLPTTEFFPNQYTGDPDSVADVFERVCKFMDADPQRFDLGIKNCCQGGTCGTIESEDKPVVKLDANDVGDQETLIATLARAVAQDELLREPSLNVNEGDFDSLTDLLPVFLGMGIFQANTAVKSNAYHTGGWEYFSIRGAGFLQARVPGYAMALMAWIRGETNPAWANMLGTDANSAFRKGLKFVSKTSDSVFRPDNAGQPVETRSNTTIADDLRNGTRTRKVSALWDLMANPSAVSGAMEGVTACIRDSNPGVAAEAARTVATLGPDAAAALPAIVEKLSTHDATMRTYCAMAIGAIKPDLEARSDGLCVRGELLPLLSDRSPHVVDAAMHAFARYGKEAESALCSVIPRIVLYARDCEFGLLNRAVSQLASVVEDPEQFFNDQLEETDTELRTRILDELTSLKRAEASTGDEPT